MRTLASNKPLAAQLVVLALVVVLTGACGASSATLPAAAPSQTPVPALSSVASPFPVPTAPPTPPAIKTVLLRPDQIIMSLADLPFVGWKISEDKERPFPAGHAWVRGFTAPKGSDIYGVSLIVTVSESGITRAYGANAIAYSCSSDNEDLSQAVSGPSLGEYSIICQVTSKQHPERPADFAYTVVSRNVTIVVVLVSSKSASNDATLAQTIAIMKKQLDILERVAPR